MLKGSNQDGDGFLTFKTKFPKYDVVVGNVVNIPVISMLSPDARK